MPLANPLPLFPGRARGSVPPALPIGGSGILESCALRQSSEHAITALNWASTTAAAGGHQNYTPLPRSAVRTLGALDTLDLTGNRLTSLDGSQHLTSLTEFWCSSNHIPTFEALAPASDALGATLSCIYLEHNPLAKEYDYRQRVAALFPGITQIDATMVRRG